MKHGHNSEPLIHATKRLRELAAVINDELALIDKWGAEAPRLEQSILARQFDVNPVDGAGIAQLAADRDKLAHIAVWLNGKRRTVSANRESVIYTAKNLFEQVWNAVDFTVTKEIDIIIFQLNDQHANFLIPQGYDRDIAVGAVKSAEWIESFVAAEQPERPPAPPGQRYLSNEELLIRRRDQLTRK